MQSTVNPLLSQNETVMKVFNTDDKSIKNTDDKYIEKQFQERRSA